MKIMQRSFRVMKVSLAGLTTCIACAAWAQPSQSTPSESGARRQYALSLNPLNNDASWALRGVDGRKGVAFGIRKDERIEGLRLDLDFSYSAALLDKLSHLNVLLNGVVIQALPLKTPPTAPLSQAQVTIPLLDLQPFNVLELQLIGHYTMGCENPLHPDLWAKIEKSSKLVFDVQRLQLPDDLGLLPSPFFDARDLHAQKISFVLGALSDKRLEAAGIVASWLGALATYRGTEFLVDPAGIPERGHAIVILGQNETLPSVSLPAVHGPTVAIRPNPKDPTSKLLIVRGRDDEEIRNAIVSLTLGAQTLSGPTALVSNNAPTPRKPYDAPNWMPTDRPVYLGELLSADDFTVTGFDPPPISIGLRLPPDLSSWRTPSVPLNLKVRYSPVPLGQDATLAVLINRQFVQEIKLGDSYKGVWSALTAVAGMARQAVNLPLAMLESQAELQFKFNYPEPVRSECGGHVQDNYRSSIDPKSTIDLSTLPHHLAMPDLAAFRTAAFPYSRMADLSETVVILSKDIAPDEIKAFLSVLGKVGQSTGYPATGLTVQRGKDKLQNMDLLIIEAGPPSELLSQWASYLPKSKSELANSGWMATLSRRLTTNPFQGVIPQARMAPENGAYIAGFESPVTTGRSAIVIAGGNPEGLSKAVQFMLFDPVQAERFQGSLVIVRDDVIESVSSDKRYFVGDLGFYGSTLWFLSKNPVVLFLLFLAGSVLFAIVLFLSLHARSQQRLLSGTHKALKPIDKE